MQLDQGAALTLIAIGLLGLAQQAQARPAPAVRPEPCISDSDLIDALGGPTKLAERLQMTKGGAQRVCNWRKRGIPARVKLAHPEVFLVDKPHAAGTQQGARDA